VGWERAEEGVGQRGAEQKREDKERKALEQAQKETEAEVNRQCVRGYYKRTES